MFQEVRNGGVAECLKAAVLKSTFAVLTPSTFSSLFSTLPAQPPQVIPLTFNAHCVTCSFDVPGVAVFEDSWLGAALGTIAASNPQRKAIFVLDILGAFPISRACTAHSIRV